MCVRDDTSSHHTSEALDQSHSGAVSSIYWPQLLCSWSEFRHIGWSTTECCSALPDLKFFQTHRFLTKHAYEFTVVKCFLSLQVQFVLV